MSTQAETVLLPPRVRRRRAAIRLGDFPVIPTLILVVIALVAIFANVLVGNLASHLHGISLPKGFTSADVTPAVLSHLPAVVHQGFVAGYAESIQTVFLVAVPIAALAFLATWFIPQMELKRWPETPAAAAPEAEMAMASVTAAPEVPTQEVPAQQPPAREVDGIAQVRSASYTERT